MIKRAETDMQKIERLFRSASKLTPAEQESFLATECQGDEAVRREVAELLQAGIDTGPLDHPPETPLDFSRLSVAPAPRQPEQIGQFKILKLLASGGMGTVYEALQQQPKRTVALKVMRWELTSREALRRFHYESELLAQLQHPGIAQVYEAGVHDAGGLRLPYFAMELIAGATPITKYATEHELDVRARLDLFAKVCDAVEYGHQRGVVHRDLKPSNIVVGEDGRPRVIDFGVARSTDCDTTLTTLQTETGQLLGTLQYMSPEQCTGKSAAIDTRSDVYSLGVALFELLSGQLPYDVSGMSIYEGTRVVMENTPTTLGSADQRLRGEVETIVHKALEKEPDRRYGTPGELAADMRRYLQGEAITARPPSLAYQLKVFTRRNKTFVAAAACVLVVLVGGLISTSAALLKADRALYTSRAVSHELSGALSVAMATIPSVYQAEVELPYGDTPTTDELLNRVASLLDNGLEFSQDPLTEAELRLNLGRSFRRNGRYEEAIPQLEEAVRIRRAELGVCPEVAECLIDLFQVQRRLGTLSGNPNGGIQIIDQIIEWYESKQLRACLPVGIAFKERGNHSAGDLKVQLSNYMRALEILQKSEVPDSREIAWCLNNIGLIYGRMREFDKGREYFLRALDIRILELGPAHSHTLLTYSNLANNAIRHGNLDEAMKWSQTGWEGMQSNPEIDKDHPWYGNALGTYCVVLFLRGEYKQTDALLRDSPESVTPRVQLAYAARNTGQNDKALEYAEQAWEAAQTNPAISPEHVDYQRSVAAYGDALVKVNRYSEALPTWRIAFQHCDKLSTIEQQWTRYFLAKCLCELGEYEESEEILLALAPEVEGLQKSVKRVIEPACYEQIEELYEAVGKHDEAARWRSKREALVASGK